MPIDAMFFVLLLVVCGFIGYLVVPRVMRKWSVATKPADKRLEYAAHLGDEVDQGASADVPAESERAGHHDRGSTRIRQL